MGNEKEGSAGPALDLALDVKAGDGVRASTRPGVVAAAAVVSGRPPAIGAPAMAVDLVEARRVANFGVVPTSLLALPGYARATKARLDEIQRDITACSRKVGKTEQDLAEACWAVAQRVLATFDSLSKAARAPYQATVQHLREVDEGTPEHLAVCADFANFVLNDQATFGTEFGEAKKRIASLRALVQSQTKELALYQAALKMYDAEAVAKGKVVTMAIIAAVGVVLVSLILVAILASL